MMSKILQFFRITNAGADTQQFPVQQVSFMENTADAFIVFPYGMHANALNESIGVLLSVNGDEQNLAALVTSALARVKKLEQGEVIFYHPKTKSFTHYKNNGDIDIEANGNVNLKANSVNIDSPETNIGVGGQPIARLGDAIVVQAPAQPWNNAVGIITSGGNNTSI